jgi:hypothetical protein
MARAIELPPHPPLGPAPAPSAPAPESPPPFTGSLRCIERPRIVSPALLKAMVSDVVEAVKATLRVGLRPILDGLHPARAPPLEKGGRDEPDSPDRQFP